MPQLPRPAEPGQADIGPTVLPLGGSQAKSKALPVQKDVNQKALQRYQYMVTKRIRRRRQRT